MVDSAVVFNYNNWKNAKKTPVLVFIMKAVFSGQKPLQFFVPLFVSSTLKRISCNRKP